MVGDFGTSRKHVHMQLPVTNKNTFSPITAQAVTSRLPMAGWSSVSGHYMGAFEVA